LGIIVGWWIYPRLIAPISDVTFKLPDDAEEGEEVRFQRRVLFIERY
jgi:hypothetical protein